MLRPDRGIERVYLHRAPGEQLNWLLDGYDVWRMKPHEALHFSVFS